MNKNAILACIVVHSKEKSKERFLKKIGKVFAPVCVQNMIAQNAVNVFTEEYFEIADSLTAYIDEFKSLQSKTVMITVSFPITLVWMEEFTSLALVKDNIDSVTKGYERKQTAEYKKFYNSLKVPAKKLGISNQELLLTLETGRWTGLFPAIQKPGQILI